MRKREKIIVMGDSGVGKTALIVKMLEGRFVREYRPTIGIVIRKGILGMNSSPRNIEFWEISGKIKDNYKSILQYTDDAGAFILVVDATNENACEELSFWLHFAKSDKNMQVKNPLLIILNKIDLVDDSKKLIPLINEKITDLSRRIGIQAIILPISVKEDNLNEKLIPSILRHDQWKKRRNITTNSLFFFPR